MPAVHAHALCCPQVRIEHFVDPSTPNVVGDFSRIVQVWVKRRGEQWLDSLAWSCLCPWLCSNIYAYDI